MTKQEMIQILKEYQELIRNNDFEEFYDELHENDIAYFTDLFLKSGINPLKYMIRVPRSYAKDLKNLKEIEIPSNITSIGRAAFNRCSNLTNLIFEKNSHLTNIASDAFLGCFNLINITIPIGVINIGDWAFCNCNNLKDVYYEGSQKDWSKIDIGTHNEVLLNKATIHYNSKI